MAELARALHFGRSSADGNYLSLLENNGAYVKHNFILGQEFESFSQKGLVIERGIHTLNSPLSVRLNFNTYLHVHHMAGPRRPRSAPGREACPGGKLPRWEVTSLRSKILPRKTCFREKSNYCTNISIDPAFLMHVIIEMRINKLR